MDFVVIGLGLGALALLGGLALLCLIAPRWQRRARAAALPADAAYPAAKAAERHAAGQALLVAGAALLLATLGGISANLHDRTGAILIASVATVAALGLLAWDFVYRRQHPAPPRRRAAPRAAPVAASAPATAQRVRRAPATTPQPATASTAERPVALDAEAPAPANTAPALERVELGQADDGGAEIPVSPDAAGTAVASATSNVAETAPASAPAPNEAAPSRDLADDPDGSAALAALHGAGARTDNAPANPPPARIIDITARNGRQAGPTASPVSPALQAPDPESPVGPVATTPVPSAPVSADAGAAPEPDTGDDRVLALFPTAAARRERPTPPPDVDGER